MHFSIQAQEQQEYEKWKKKQQQEVQKFIDERDKAFTEFLKKEWREMQAMQGLVADEQPKPQQLPVYTPPPAVSSKMYRLQNLHPKNLPTLKQSLLNFPR